MRCWRLLLGLLTALPLLLGAGEAKAQAPSPNVYGAYVPDGDYYILGFGTSQCLDVPNWETRPIDIQLFPLRFQANQLWRVRRQSDDGFYKITNVYSGLALDVPNGSMSPGVHIQQYYPHYPYPSNNQRWRFDLNYAVSGTQVSRRAFYRIVNKNSGLRLDVPNGDYSTHQFVQQFTPNSGWNQTWDLIPR
jgi:hypothetical protein